MRILLPIATLLVLLTGAAWAEENDKKADEKSKSQAPPRAEPVPMPSDEKIDASIQRGIEYLLGKQNKDGSWGSARRTKGLNIYAPVPGAHHAFRTAVTSLCIMALSETGADDPRVAKSLARAEEWLIEKLPRLRRANGIAIYNVWGHAYSIQALRDMHDRTDDPDRKVKCIELIRSQIEMLEKYESVDGGWGYYDFRYQTKKPSSSSISFVNATGMIALHEAEQIGVSIPEKLVKRAYKATKRQQLPNHAYLYGEYLKDYPVMGINRPGGSLGRSQACNLAMQLWGDETVTEEVIVTWLHRLFARNGWLDIGRKRPIPHESWFQVAGYFYYYGHYYAALSFEKIAKEKRPFFQAHMATIMLDRQEKDGSWFDYPFYDYHQPYGTAFALMCLHRCRDVDAKE